MFRRAEAWGWASKNPMRIATRPRRKSQKREPVLLGPAEVEMIRSAMGPRDAALVSVLAYAGLRPGEALALTWADITQTHIRVDKALSMGQLRGTKTGKERRVPLIAPLRSDLTQWRMRIGGRRTTSWCSPTSLASIGASPIDTPGRAGTSSPPSRRRDSRER